MKTMKTIITIIAIQTLFSVADEEVRCTKTTSTLAEVVNTAFEIVGDDEFTFQSYKVKETSTKVVFSLYFDNKQNPDEVHSLDINWDLKLRKFSYTYTSGFEYNDDEIEQPEFDKGNYQCISRNLILEQCKFTSINEIIKFILRMYNFTPMSSYTRVIKQNDRLKHTNYYYRATYDKGSSYKNIIQVVERNRSQSLTNKVSIKILKGFDLSSPVDFKSRSFNNIFLNDSEKCYSELIRK